MVLIGKQLRGGGGGCSLTGLEINFFAQEPAGDSWKKFGRQIINFGCQLI